MGIIFSNLQIFIHARVYVFISDWGKKISPYPKVPSLMSSLVKGLRPLALCCLGHLSSKDMGLT